MTGESIFNIFTKSVLQDLLKKLKIEFTNSWKKDKLVELLCEGDLKKALNKMTTEQLKVVLDDMNLSQSGKKSLLIDRILDGEVGESNKESSSSRSNSKSALQEFTDFVSGSHENDKDSEDLFNLIGSWRENSVRNFKRVHNEIDVWRNDHRRVECVDTVIVHAPSDVYLWVRSFKYNGEIESPEEWKVIKVKKIERVKKETVLVMKSDEWSGEAILSEKVTSHREIK